jgi:WD40 repeat protein
MEECLRELHQQGQVNVHTVGQVTGALELYKGDFLEGFSVSACRRFEDWWGRERERLHHMAVDGLSELVAYQIEQGEYQLGMEHAARLLELDPLMEAGHRQMMRLLAYCGQRTAALAQYESCQALLREELGIEPEQETRVLYEQIRAGELEMRGGSEPQLEFTHLPRRVEECPYRGLSAFQEADAPFYFGRELFVDELERAVRSKQLVTVIVGSSGSGKSSALFAGLLPRLREAGGYRFAITRPGLQPFYALAGALLPLLESGLSETEHLAETRKLAEHLVKGEVSLGQVVERVLEKDKSIQQVLLVVDQFEELYTLCPDGITQNAFIDELLVLVAAGQGRRQPPCSVLITLRADFMGQVLAHRPFADALQDACLLMGPMTRMELHRAIEQPAEMQGAAFEAGLVERILDDVGEKAGVLPLLEFTLTQLWERQEDGWLAHADYEAMGCVDGALADYADQVYGELRGEEQEPVRHALVQLVQPGEGTEDTRRIATREELGEESWDLIQHLANERLVVTGRDAQGRETAEVVHEALIQKWGRFQEWMDSDRAFRQWQERLRGSLRQWQESGGDEGALLRGTPLGVSENWLAERGEQLSEVEIGFIQESQDLAERQQRERQRRRQRVVVGLVAGLVVALALAAFALFQRQEAIVQRQEAITQRENSMRQAALLLAGQAENELADGYHDRAVLLALAAIEDYPYTPQAEHALGQAVSYNRALQIYSEHKSAVTSVAWSPDGTKVASSSSSENRVDIWDAGTGETVLTIEMPQGITGNIVDMALHVQWTPDGQRLLTLNGDRYSLGSQDYDLLLWDATSGELISSLEIPNQVEPVSGEWSVTTTNYPTSAAAEIAPRSGRLATLGGDNTAILWDPDWEKPELVLKKHTESVSSVDWSPDETRLATASLDGTAVIWDAQSGEALYTLSGHDERLNLVLWSPDGASLATAGQDGTIWLWDGANGELLGSIETNAGFVFSLAWAPNSGRLVSGQADGSLRIWDVVTGKLLETLRGHQGIITDLKWLPVDDRLVSSDGSGDVRVWNTGPSTAWRLYPPQAERGGDWTVNGVSWSSDGRFLVLAGGDVFGDVNEPPSFEIWDVQSNQLIMQNLGEVLNLIGAEAHYSPDNQTILYRGSGAFPDIFSMATAYVFGARSGEIISSFTEGSEALIRSMAWSPDGSQIATGLFTGKIIIWDYQTGQKITTLVHSEKDDLAINYVEWSADGSKIAGASDDSTAKVWDAHKWEHLYTLQHEPPTYVCTAAWSPDGTRLLTTAGNDEQGAKDNTTRIWDATTGEELLVIEGHAKSVWPGTWSPDGRRIATFSNDGTVKIWDAITGNELLTLAVPALYSGHSLWSPDGQHLAIVGLETLISVWRVWQTTQELIDYAKECCVVRELTEAERQQFGLR